MTPAAALLVPVLLAPVGLETRADGEQLVVTNHGSIEILGLRAGEATRERLEPGASWTTAKPEKLSVGGRFPLERWREALDDTGPAWADIHLRTAGFYLDALDAGAPGAADAANLKALAAVDASVAGRWVGDAPVRMALAARAAWHVPPGTLLGALLARVDPGAEPVALAAPYEKLEPAVEGIRIAIERHGLAALEFALAFPPWAADRGLAVPGLAAAWGRQGAIPPPPEADALGTALREGDREAAIRLGVAAALAGETSHLVCGALDLGVARAIANGHLLAGEGHLRLAARVCPASAALRQRAAHLMRVRGERAFRSGALTTAAEWFRAGWWLAGEPADKGRLADTLAELALLHYERGDTDAGTTFLEQAREVAPLRPRVMDAFGARPHADPKVRIAVIVILVLMLLFLTRRLRKLLGDRPEPMSVKRKRLRM